MDQQVGGDLGKLVLVGGCTLRTAEDTCAALLNMAACHAEFEIDCSNVEEVDLSFIQLLLAARSSARQSGRTVRLAQPASGPLHDALLRGGFLEAIDGREADRAFWLESEIR